MKNKLEKINKIVTNIVRIIIILMAIFMIYKKDYGNLGVLAITIILTFYDKIVTKVLKIKLPEELKLSLILFIFSAQVLGTVLDFYGKFLWWDTMLHSISGIIFFFIGETLIKQLNQKTTNANISSIVIIVFSLVFSLATGTIWEIFEFAIDGIMGQNMQITEGLMGRDAIMDTMIDLISLTIGVVIITIIEVIKIRKCKGD